ncbi:helix-turn-helix domain-containing protein [Adlercreutzia agrestimuris]|uniref:helix-turn-helix domain-containing protein n=1 Tax=Adlercreutzia agrestimuris TaxID=2941324 RepID=UPI0020400456|nr:helix-turn-helix domain-containing protein [Adlercreutzia agrestimuris]
MDRTNSKREFLTVREYAEILGVCEKTVIRHCATGKIEAIKIGRTWRIPLRQLSNAEMLKELDELREELEEIKSWKQGLSAALAK